MQRGCAGGAGRGYYAAGLRADVPGRPSLGCSRPFTSCRPGEMRNERLRALLVEREIGVLVYAGLFLSEDAGIQKILKDKAAAGARVRILLGDPDSQVVADRGDDEGIGDTVPAKVRNALALYRPLRQVEGVEFRFHRTVLYNSIYRADDQVLVNTHVFGLAAAQAPAWHLRKLPGGELAS